MKLIEQLGGYEECKRLREVPAASSFSIRGIKFTRDQLESSLLEYRRENKLYEAGDQVFVDFISSNKVESDGTRITGSGVIDRVDPDGFLYGRLNDGGYFGCPSSDVKHEK